MKLGTETGSVSNHVMSMQTRGQPEPEVGMGATLLCWTDRKGATITSVFTKGKYTYIGVKEDQAKRVDNNGFSEQQEYQYTFNPEALEKIYRFNGVQWERVVYNENTGRYNKLGGEGLKIGVRQTYWDPCF